MGYYEDNAKEYIAKTKDADLSEEREELLNFMPPKGKILDVGFCSGRDSLAFKKLGYDVLSIDNCIDFYNYGVSLGLNAELLSIQDISYVDEFDGIWASASLLHCKYEELSDVLNKIYKAMKEDAAFYCSFKYGDFEGIRDERYYTDMTLDRMNELLKDTSLIMNKCWIKEDLMQREGKWINFILTKKDNRSISSKLTETLIKNRPMISRTEEEYKEHILSLGENDKISMPLFASEIETDTYQGIKVLKWNRNDEDPDQTIIFYVHGGEFVFNPMLSHFDSLREIARKTDSYVIMPIYHKLPNYTYKDNYQILLSLYEYVISLHPTSKIILMGDSAGGGIAFSLAQMLRDQGIRQPDQIILISPWVDLEINEGKIDEVHQEDDPLLETWKLQILGKMWAGDKDIKDPVISPIYGDLDSLGHITLFVGTREIFYPDIIRLHNALASKSIAHDLFIGEGQNHVYVLYPIKEGKEARETIANIIGIKEQEEPLEKIDKVLKEDNFSKRLENFTKETLVLISKLMGKDKDKVEEITANPELSEEEIVKELEKLEEE